MSRLNQRVAPLRSLEFGRRRWRHAVITASALAAFGLWLSHESALLRNPAWTSGWTLLGAIAFLTALSLRKRLSFLPLGSVSAWMQAHLHVGWASIVLAVFHVGFEIPNGLFEQILAAGFAGLAASGLYGAWLSRTAPKRLASLPNEIRYEAIPTRRRQLEHEANSIVKQSAATTGVLGDFHLTRTAEFFARSRSWSYWLYPTGDLRRQLENDLVQLDRYLTDEQRQYRVALSRAVRERDDLDYHQALQGRLKFWLFAHVSATYMLWVLIAIHVAVVHAFRGA